MGDVSCDRDYIRSRYKMVPFTQPALDSQRDKLRRGDFSGHELCGGTAIRSSVESLETAFQR